ncbi:MAG: methyltransferase [Gemmatimonadaceae bacterium]|nr:methyltransferase [Gemmatimonadaceae bacterium]
MGDAALTTDYRQWTLREVSLDTGVVQMASKPGVLLHGELDPAAQMLAESVACGANDVLLQLQGGNGLLGVIAARAGATVWISDRHLPGAEAAERTLRANEVSGTVCHGMGLEPFAVPPAPTVVAIRLPVEKFAVRQLLHDAWHALPVGGRCVVAGANDEGAKSAARMLERVYGEATVIAQHSGHRAVAAVKTAKTPADDTDIQDPRFAYDVFHEMPANLRGESLTLASRPGVFSWEHPDEATTLLADAIEIPVGASVLDLGCGSGGLGIVAARLSRTGRVVLVDADAEAVRSARRSVTLASATTCEVMASDVAGAVLDERFDVVVTNPPFHIGKGTDLRVPRQFIADAAQVLPRGGTLWLVANRTLPYEGLLRDQFAQVAIVRDERRFKVLRATR